MGSEECEAMATVAESVSGAVETVKSWPQRLRAYIEGLRMEMRRVTWPSRKQVRATTVVVIAAIFGFALYFFLVDYLVLGRAIDWVLRNLSR